MKTTALATELLPPHRLNTDHYSLNTDRLNDNVFTFLLLMTKINQKVTFNINFYDRQIIILNIWTVYFESSLLFQEN